MGMTVGFGIPVALAIVLLVYVISILGRVNGKTRMNHERLRVKAQAASEVLPELQVESDTCGLHTLRVMYKAYGLDPDLENLRNRLGIAVPTNPLDRSSTGTLQPDMLRVLVQDGFDYRLWTDGYPSFEVGIKDHLENHMAAALIRTRQSGNLHWVAVDVKAAPGYFGSVLIWINAPR